MTVIIVKVVYDLAKTFPILYTHTGTCSINNYMFKSGLTCFKPVQSYNLETIFNFCICVPVGVVFRKSNLYICVRPKLPSTVTVFH